VLVVMAGADPVEPRDHVHCTHCDERFVTVLPLKLDTYVAVIRAFNEQHKDCRKT
jgi:hypothetical protein